MFKAAMNFFMTTAIRKIGKIARWFVMKEDSMYRRNYPGELIAHSIEKWGIKFIYYLPSDGSGYVVMDRPINSFLCPHCEAAMNYRLFGQYICENPECRHKTKAKIWGEWKLYDFMQRQISKSINH